MCYTVHVDKPDELDISRVDTWTVKLSSHLYAGLRANVRSTHATLCKRALSLAFDMVSSLNLTFYDASHKSNIPINVALF